ncbi:TetR/AcrR family transcriptional regulator [Agromyces sp. SYSU K20354]|uniref:TetR/AcrR family transcriptional regulator n=1 Tax=Agromyces cavernae TaxID=2898659 RepID=UPI001E2FCCC7|nr:TetR/AcrR family transcriptional regulator [Agromyces cavernae]MCD2440659.1 TetR/AcrR family transcriptional regulator [Agromyces cavernae]
MATKPEILDSALDVLRAGDALTIDAVARVSGLTKPGVVHHFATKEGLTLAVLDHLLLKWEAELSRRAGAGADAMGRLRAYIEYTLMGDMDPADLALLADPRLRVKLSVRWAERMNAWFGESDHPQVVAARLIADGAWIDRCLGMLPLDDPQRAAVVDVALSLLPKDSNS